MVQSLSGKVLQSQCIKKKTCIVLQPAPRASEAERTVSKASQTEQALPFRSLT